MALTDKQHRFVLEYVRNGNNIYRAARLAGYTHDFAHGNAVDMVKKPEIIERIEATFDHKQRELNAQVDWIVRKLKMVIDQGIPDDGTQAQPIRVKLALSAAQELNKMCGNYAPDKVLKMTVDATKQKLVEASRKYKEY